MKNMIKKGFWVLLALFAAITPEEACAQQANAILDKAAQKYKESNGVSASFSLQVQSSSSRKTEDYNGSIQMKGDKFTLKTPDASTWYDGRTQWVYMKQTGEVNVSNPTGDELQFTNPMILLNSYKTGFTTKYDGESTNQNGKRVFDILLTPKNAKSNIRKIVLRIDKVTYYPASITVTNKNGISNTILISKLKTGLNQPASFFVFDEKKYPDAEVIDLR